MFVHLLETKDKTENRKKYAYIKGLRNKGLDPMLQKLKFFEIEQEAYEFEAFLIKLYGRKDFEENGILTNVCLDNRPPNAKGRKYSAAVRLIYSLAKRGPKNPMFGVSERSEKWYAAMKFFKGGGNPFYGKTHSDAQKEIWTGWDRGNRRGKTLEEILGFEKAQETKKKLHDANIGKVQTPETIQKIKDARAKQIISPESYAKAAEKRRGRKQSPETVAKRVATRERNRLARLESNSIGHGGLNE
jgi:hypothetical protein